MKTKQDGHGSVTEVIDPRTGEVRYWARAPLQPDGRRPSLGKFDTRDEADRALLIDRANLATKRREGLPIFEDFAADILDEREEDGVRGIENERSRYRAHVAPFAWTKKRLDEITTADGTEWLRQLSRKKARGKETKLEIATIQGPLTLVCAIFDAAGPNGRQLIDRNPFLGLEVKRKAGAEATKEKWTFLTAEDEEWFSRPRATSNGYVTELERLMILFGEGSGIRQGEQFHLHLDDLHLDPKTRCDHEVCPFSIADEQGLYTPHAVVRYGSEGLPRKNGKILYAAIFGPALEAARRWLPMRARLGIKGELVFPLPSGKPRRRSKPLGNGRFVEVSEMRRMFRKNVQGTHVWGSKNPVRVKKEEGALVYLCRWKEVLLIAGIKRNVRWHDVRHSCASALAQGRWGVKVDPRLIQAQLGHSSLQMTERYSHLAGNALAEVAKQLSPVGSPLVTGGCTALGTSVDSSMNPEVEQRGIEPLTSALRTPGILELLQALRREKGETNQLVTNLAGALAAALESDK